jgi:hypothetical protein
MIIDGFEAPRKNSRQDFINSINLGMLFFVVDDWSNRYALIEERWYFIESVYPTTDCQTKDLQFYQKA